MATTDPMGSTPSYKNVRQTAISFSEIEFMIDMALRSPSGDNCQPWAFTWSENTLTISYAEKLGAHALNNNNHATWLTLGCLYESLVISASGLRLHVDPTFDFINWSTSSIVVLNFTRMPIKADPLIAEIKKRRTTRQPFLKEKISEDVVKQMKVVAQAFPNVQLSVQQNPPTPIMDYLCFCDAFMWKNLTVTKDFLKLVHLNDHGQSTSGMPWTTLGLKKRDLLPLKLFKRFPQLVGVLWKLGFEKQIQKMTRTMMNEQGGLYSLAIEDANPANIVEAGRLAYRLWLYLVSEGYSVQPTSIPSMTGFDVVTGYPPPQTTSESIEKFKVGHNALREYFGFSKGALPVWMFRAGKTATPTILPIMPRPSVTDRLKVR